jgi:type I restriction enzyme R subunit
MPLIPESERLTRKRRIDPQLGRAGWTVAPLAGATTPATFHHKAVEEFPTDNGPVDYALCVGGHAFGLVEAKKLATGPQNVLTQAERNSAGMTSNPAKYAGYPLRHGEFRVPFLYSTNGEVIWFRDCRHPQNLSRKVAHFHTPTALQELLSRDLDQACD